MLRQIALPLLSGLFLVLAAPSGHAQRAQSVLTVGAMVMPAACTVSPIETHCAGPLSTAAAHGLMVPAFTVAGQDAETRITIAY